MKIVASNAAFLSRERAGMKLTPTQVIIGMKEEGLISEAEALEMAQTGKLPTLVEQMISSLDETSRFRARVFMAKGGVIGRNDPIILLLQQYRQLPDENVDLFFNKYSAV
jgi:hypothetical protein